MKPPYPLEVVGAMVRAGDARAVGFVVSELKRCKGNVRETARALGIGERTLYSWRDGNAELAAAFAEHAMGRIGAGPHAARVRKGST